MAADSARTLARVPFSFTGTIDPTRLSWGYRAGLLVVAVAMLLLPLIYLGVIALSAAGVWWHITRHVSWVQEGGTGLQWRLIGYIAPALAGMVVTFFMIKPVFARRPREREPLTLTAAEHPALFAFIAQICGQVRAPMPRRVQVDCQINASASFAPRWRSVIRRDLVLTIGLPLVHALSVRELGGVLAHEFGHFAQGSGLRVTMVVRGINAWFSRVVFERDNWDRRLDTWSHVRDGRLMLLILPSRVGVWLSRQVLKLLMLGGHAISCFMTRQMEYDADSYEVKLAGSEAFVSTMRRLHELNVAMLHSTPYMKSEFAARRLPVDLPLFLVAWQRARPMKASASDAALPSRGTRLFATHPSDEDRLAAAARAADRGILLGGNEPAAGLFRDFTALSRNATRRHYENRGVLEEVSLVDALDCVQASLGREERQQAFRTMFEYGVSRFRPLRIPLDATEEPPPVVVQTWRFPDALERFDDRVKQRTAAFVAQELLQGGIAAFDSSQLGLSEWTLEAAAASEREAVEKIGVLSEVIEPYERLRLHLVARGLNRLGRAGEAQCSAHNLAALMQALDTVAAALEIALTLWPLRYAQAMLTQELERSPRPELTRQRREHLASLANETFERLRQMLAAAPCPVLLGFEAVTLDGACRLGEVGEDRMQATIAIETVYTRLLLEACWLSCRGEAMSAGQPAAV